MSMRRIDTVPKPVKLPKSARISCGVALRSTGRTLLIPSTVGNRNCAASWLSTIQGIASEVTDSPESQPVMVMNANSSGWWIEEE